MGRPYLGTKPFVVRLLPVEIGVVTLAAAREGAARSAQAWAVRVLWESACRQIGADRAAAIRAGGAYTPEEAAAIAGLAAARPSEEGFPPRVSEADRQLTMAAAMGGAAPSASAPAAPGAPSKRKAAAGKRDSRRQAAGRKVGRKERGR